MNNEFQVLVYHRLGKETSPEGLTMAYENFVGQMQCIRRNYHPMLLGEIVKRLQGGRPIPPRAVAVTFDDGYVDTFTHAFPLLQRDRIPATLFITTGYIDREIFPPTGAPMLSWRMIQEMQRSGIEIGSHTITHPNLSKCSQQDAEDEIVNSRKRLEKKLKTSIQLFAYPYGRSSFFNRKIKESVRKAGYLAACTTLLGINTPDTDPYALHRISFAKKDIRGFAFQLSQWMDRGLPANAQKSIFGVNPKTIRLWKTRYPWLHRRLTREDLLLYFGKPSH